MIFLFNQHWDIIPGKEEEYTKFVINHYIPTMKKMGSIQWEDFMWSWGKVPGSSRWGQWIRYKNSKRPWKQKSMRR